MNIKHKKAIEKFKNKCVENNLKITPQRTVIYKHLLNSKDHPTAEHIYKDVSEILPNIAFDTVYRTLMTFSEIGLIKKVGEPGNAKRFDPDTGQHHHFVCRQCGKIIDFYDSDLDDLKIPASIAGKFNIASKKVVLEGLCDICTTK